MATSDAKSMGAVSIVGGIIVILLGVWLRSKAPSFQGDWPAALSMGCFIFGVGSIIFGANNLKQ